MARRDMHAEDKMALRLMGTPSVKVALLDAMAMFRKCGGMRLAEYAALVRNELRQRGESMPA